MQSLSPGSENEVWRQCGRGPTQSSGRGRGHSSAWRPDNLKRSLSESVECEVDGSEWESRELGLGLTWSVECQCEADGLRMSN